MAKTRRLITENLGNVDIIIELLDARIPQSSKNPEIKRLTTPKPTLTLLNKCSLADPAEEIEELRASAPRNAIAVWNKLDLAPGFVPPETGFSTVAVSAATGAGKEELLDLFQQKLLAETGSGALPEVAVNARISDHLEKAAEGLTLAAEKFQLSMYELAASDLAFSMEALGKAVGKTVSPDVLDAVFHNFCIGK